MTALIIVIALTIISIAIIKIYRGLKKLIITMTDLFDETNEYLYDSR